MSGPVAERKKAPKPKASGQAPNAPRTPAERDFDDAIDRLLAGTPRDPGLIQRALEGSLKVNFSTVALEARRSRTLIAIDGCALPRIRERIETLGTVRISTSAARVSTVKALLANKRALLHDIRVKDTCIAALMLRIEELEKRLFEAEGTHGNVERLRRRRHT